MYIELSLTDEDTDVIKINASLISIAEKLFVITAEI